MPWLALLHTSSKYVADRHFGGLQSEHKHKYVDPPPSESSFYYPEPKTTTALKVYLSTVYYYYYYHNTLQQSLHTSAPYKTNSFAFISTQWPPSPTTSPTCHRRTSRLALAHHQPALCLQSPPNRHGHGQEFVNVLSRSTCTPGFGACEHRYQLRILIRIFIITHHLNTLPPDIEPHLTAWYAAIMQCIRSFQYDLILDAPCASYSEQLPVTHLTLAANSG